MRFQITKITPLQWTELAEDAHRAVFSEVRAATTDRIDFALLAHDPVDKGVLGYVTIRELDESSIYFQYGGAFSTCANSTLVLPIYKGFISEVAKKYKRVTTLVENENIPYLKLAMKVGFRIIGVRMFKGTILVELYLDLERADYAI